VSRKVIVTVGVGDAVRVWLDVKLRVEVTLGV